MKKVLPVIFLLLLGATSFGQKVRFGDTTNNWRVITYSCGGDPGAYLTIDSFASDTTYHGVNYHILTNGYYKTLIREDTVANKIYAVDISNWEPIADTTEQLLYDYSLAVGDTFTCSIAKHVVQNIDSVVINGAWHRVWFLQWVMCPGCTTGYGSTDYQVIEGIGSTGGPLFSLFPYFFEACVTLTCFNNQGTTPPLSHKAGYYFDNSSSCNLTFGLSASNLATNGNAMSVYPVPATDELTISASSPITSVQISNLVGQEVYRSNFNVRQVTINTTDLPTGGYLLRINGTEVRKFVKQ